MNWLTKRVNVALLCAAAALGVVGQGHAAYVVINADPAFTTDPASPLVNLGWRASGALYIPDECKDAAIAFNQALPGVPVVLGPLGIFTSLCAASKFENVKLFFYDTRDPAKSTLETLSINYYFADTGFPASRNSVTQELIDFSFLDGELSGFHTSLSFPKLANVDVAGGGAYRFSLEFSSDTARLVAFGATGPTNYWNRVAESSVRPAVDIGPLLTDEQYAALQIPEPGSMALALLALGAATALRRRRV